MFYVNRNNILNMDHIFPTKKKKQKPNTVYKKSLQKKNYVLYGKDVKTFF